MNIYQNSLDYSKFKCVYLIYLTDAMMMEIRIINIVKILVNPDKVCAIPIRYAIINDKFSGKYPGLSIYQLRKARRGR